MARPTIDDEVVERLTDAVDARTKVPAEHLAIEERVAFLVDELEDADTRADRLEDRVESLEAQLEKVNTNVDTATNARDPGNNHGGRFG